MLWNVQISRVKKFFLIILFSGGVFVIIGSILRFYFILSAGPKGGFDAAVWGFRELFVAFIIGNVPMIYGGIRIWLRKFMSSKFYASLRSGTSNWLSANGYGGHFWRTHRGQDRTASEKHASAKKSTSLGSESKSSSVRASCVAPQRWNSNQAGSRIDTNVRSSHTYLAEMGAGQGIEVTRGIKVNVESVRSRPSEAETIGRSSDGARTDSEVYLGSFLTESLSEKPHLGRGLDMPSADRPIREPSRSVPTDAHETRSAMADDPNVTKWISDDTP
jgi:hypothetical protein